MPEKKITWNHTVWKFHDFSITQILCEIKFLKAEIYQLRALKLEKMAFFALLESSNLISLWIKNLNIWQHWYNKKSLCTLEWYCVTANQLGFWDFQFFYDLSPIVLNNDNSIGNWFRTLDWVTKPRLLRVKCWSRLPWNTSDFCIPLQPDLVKTWPLVLQHRLNKVNKWQLRISKLSLK